MVPREIIADEGSTISSWIATDCGSQSRERKSANDDTVAANGVVAENETRANAIRYCAHLDRSQGLFHLRVWSPIYPWLFAASKNLFYSTPFLPKKRDRPPNDLSSREALEKQTVVRTRSAPPVNQQGPQYIFTNPLKQELWYI